MGTTENPSTEVPKPQTTTHVSIDEQIGKMKLAFGNARLPEIFEPMKTVGYTEEKIGGLQTELTGLEVKHQACTKEYADQYAETDKFNAKQTEVDAAYTKHRKLAKINFKGNVQARAALKLDETKPRLYASWVQQAANFYAQLASTPDLQTKAATVGITAESVATQKLALADLQALKESQRKETAEAQAATDARDHAFDALYPKYSEYIQYAKIVLPNNQALEAIGVKVKAK
ncbi:MAG: hypothetical protein WCK78_07565 [Paludibacter sp.]